MVVVVSRVIKVLIKCLALDVAFFLQDAMDSYSVAKYFGRLSNHTVSMVTPQLKLVSPLITTANS